MKINLTNDISVQQGSVVSKTIVKHDGGNITLFAFDQGQALSEHTAPYDATFHCVSGSFLVTIDSTEHTINKDELIIFPAGKPHSVTALQPSHCLLVMIKSAK
jgi:quercetin dioxygenase-like cupin family protein